MKLKRLRGLALALLLLVGALAWAVHAERRAAGAARALCAAITVGMPAAQARARVAAAEGLDRRIDTPEGTLAVFSGALIFSRHLCQVEMSERVTATRVSHLD
jgi:uncharacterized membrane protein